METGNIVQKDFVLSGSLGAETQTIGGQLSSDNGRIGGALSATEGLGGALSFLGKPGLSAYQIAVLYGYEGTEEEWIESLNGLTPEIEVEEIPNGYIFTITIGEEVQTFTIFKGEKGVYIGSDEMPEGYCIQIDPDGDLDGILAAMIKETIKTEIVKGRDYFDGKTPVKGIDYLTKEEENELIQKTLAQVPSYDDTDLIEKIDTLENKIETFETERITTFSIENGILMCSYIKGGN